MRNFNLAQLSVGELLALSRATLRELKRRGVIRTSNAPTGDYAELLVQRATRGKLAPNSQRSWDVETPGGARLQVKARVVVNPAKLAERQLSTFRSWDFDATIIVLFDDDFRVWRASCVPVAVLAELSQADDYVGGNRIFARDTLLDAGEDWTERLQVASQT